MNMEANMEEVKAKLLKDSQAAAEAIDLKYTDAEFAEQIKMKASRDAAFEAVAAARRQLMDARVVVSQAHLDEMGAIRSEINGAAQSQALIAAAGKLTAFLVRAAA